MASFTYPVIIKRPGVQKPKKAGIYYIIAANGNFLHKKLSWVEATIPVKKIAVLEEQETEVHVLLPSLPRLILAKTVAFFRKVYTAHKSEAIVLLHYNNSASAWDMSVPLQHVSAAAISEYDKQQRLEGYACMGTIHSHANMGAFHSGTDQRDEAECADGIHITIGNVNMENGFSMDTEVAVNGSRFYLDSTWCDGVTKHICAGFSCSLKHPFSVKEKLVDVECQEIQNWNVPDEWMRQVFYVVPWQSRIVGQYGDSARVLYERREPDHPEKDFSKRPPVSLDPAQILFPAEEKEVPSTLTGTVKEIWKNFTTEQKAENEGVRVTRNGIRIVDADEQKEMRHVDLNAAVKKRETRGESTAQSGKKTQKLSWFSQQILLTAPEQKIKKEKQP